LGIDQSFYAPLPLLPSIKVFRDDFRLPEIKHPGSSFVEYFNEAERILDPEWDANARKIGISIATAMVFYKPSGYRPTHAHIDVTRSDPENPVTCALNFTVDGTGESSMVWYWQKTAAKKLEYVAEGIPAATFPIEGLAELHRVHIGPSFTLVRTNIPHAIECGANPRWCVSLRVKHGILKTWEDALGFFRNVSYTDWGR
jgi:hypothetical protein